MHAMPSAIPLWRTASCTSAVMSLTVRPPAVRSCRSCWKTFTVALLLVRSRNPHIVRDAAAFVTSVSFGAVDWPRLAGIPAEQVRELRQVARRRRFARNEVVFHRDDPADSLHLINNGRFAIRVMTPLGDVATMAIRGP